MISSDIIRGYNDLIILHLLIERDKYGYEISKEISEKTKGDYIIKETTLYSAFNRLWKNNYIKVYAGDETQGSKRKYYTITNLGLEYYKERCLEWETTKKVINQFVKKEDL